MSIYTQVEVTVTKLYIIPTEDENKVKELISEWFSERYLKGSHAFRDSCSAYGFNSFVDFKIINKIDF